MALHLTVLLSFLNAVGFKGSRILAALFALQLGASPLTIGLLAATYAGFSLFLAVHAGRVSDRIGVRVPMQVASAAMLVGLVVPVVYDSMLALFVSATILGLANTLYHVNAQNVIGAIGRTDQRAANFSTFSLGGAASAVVGPVLAGFGIDHFGYSATYLLLAVIATAPGVVLVFYTNFIPTDLKSKREDVVTGSIGELLREPVLRNIMIASGLVLTGLDLFNFYMPIYGRSIGLGASAIGIIVGTQGAAAFVVRVWMPHFARRFGELEVLVASLVMAGLTYFLFPLFQNPYALTAIAFLLGLGLGCGQPLSTLLTYNHSPAGRIGEALGLRLAFNKFTQIAVPLVFGSMGTAFGAYPIFWCNAALLLTGGYLIARPHRTVVKEGEA